MPYQFNRRKSLIHRELNGRMNKTAKKTAFIDAIYFNHIKMCRFNVEPEWWWRCACKHAFKCKHFNWIWSPCFFFVHFNILLIPLHFGCVWIIVCVQFFKCASIYKCSRKLWNIQCNQIQSIISKLKWIRNAVKKMGENQHEWAKETVGQSKKKIQRENKRITLTSQPKYFDLNNSIHGGLSDLIYI